MIHDVAQDVFWHGRINCLVLVGGIPAYAGKTDASLRLIDIGRWEELDNVLLRDEIRHKSR
jgi:hypothetical protein